MNIEETGKSATMEPVNKGLHGFLHVLQTFDMASIELPRLCVNVSSISEGLRHMLDRKAPDNVGSWFVLVATRNVQLPPMSDAHCGRSALLAALQKVFPQDQDCLNKFVSTFNDRGYVTYIVGHRNTKTPTSKGKRKTKKGAASALEELQHYRWRRVSRRTR